MATRSDKIFHAGRHPAVGSDRVQASVIDTGFFGCGRGRIGTHLEVDEGIGGGGSQAAIIATGQNGTGQAIKNNTGTAQPRKGRSFSKSHLKQRERE